jgi:hypothetical protein
MHLRTRTKLLLGATAAAAIALPLLVVAPNTAGAATCAAAPTSIHVTITTPARVIYPQKATITGIATQDDSSPACGAVVSITAQSGGGAGQVQYLSTVGETGRFGAVLWLGRSTTYTANATYAAGGLTAAPDVHLVVMYPRIGITSVTPTTVKRGGTLYVAGSVQPGGLTALPHLEIFDKTGAWHKVATAYYISPSGVWSLRWLVPTARHVGIASIRATMPSTTANGPGTSSSRTISVV